MSGYTTSISKFKANPNSAIKDAGGEPVAVAAHNEIQFYAVPSNLFEEIMTYIEVSQRQFAARQVVPGQFRLMEDTATKVAAAIRNLDSDYSGEFIEGWS